MPYIDKESRDWIDPFVKELLQHIAVFGVGDLNYTITKIVHKWLIANGLRYNHINAAIGVLECVKQELYRMVAAPYENIKQAENGCISELDKC